MENIENNTVDTQQSEEQQTEKLSFTQEELDALIQKESDKRVSQAMKTADRKNQQKIKEAERLAQMSATEKYEYELQQREKAIAEKEKQLALAENKAEAGKALAERGISVSLVDMVVAEDAEVMMANIKLLETEFKKSVKAEVENRLKTTTPKKNLPIDKELTKESFAKMNLKEQADLYRDNPTLYKQLVGG